MDIILIDIPTIKGNSIYATHKDKIILESFSHGCEMSMADNPSNTERTTGRVHFQPMSFTKFADQATPQLYAACAGGAKLGTAKVYIGRTENKAFMEQVRYELSEAMVQHITTGGGGGSVMDTFMMNFTEIKTFYTQQNADSTKAGVADFGWNLKTNEPA